MNHQKRQTMYDRIKIRLNADKLPKNYDWHAVLAGVDNGSTFGSHEYTTSRVSLF